MAKSASPEVKQSPSPRKRYHHSHHHHRKIGKRRRSRSRHRFFPELYPYEEESLRVSLRCRRRRYMTFRAIIICITIVRILTCITIALSSLHFGIKYAAPANRIYDIATPTFTTQTLTYTVTSFTSVFSVAEVILLIIQFASLLTFVSREYAFFGISLSLDFAFTFLVLFFYLLLLAVGLKSPEVSSTLLAGAGTLLRNYPDKFLHTVNNVQKSMECCGFAGNYREWMENRTIYYYDPIEDKSKVMLSGKAESIWKPKDRRERMNAAPLSCCPNPRTQCSSERKHREGCFNKFSTYTSWLMHAVSMAIALHIILSVLQEVIFTYVAADITVSNSSTESSISSSHYKVPKKSRRKKKHSLL